MPIIINGRIIGLDGITENQAIIYNRTIEVIKPISQGDLTRHETVIDAQGAYIMPGLIDIHMHGCQGYDVMDGKMESLEQMSRYLAQQGVTSFLPTTLTMAWPKINQALSVVEQARQREMPGARVLGAHLEGPFISQAKKGAQNGAYICKPTIKPLHRYLQTIRVLTLAPEEDENFAFMGAVQRLAPHIRLSAGHSQATYTQAQAAIAAGVSGTTHLFNGMPPLHHRQPGLVGAALTRKIYSELIADTIHIHPAWYDLLQHLKGRDKIILISDAMQAAGLKDGCYELGGLTVHVQGCRATLEDHKSLAGSVMMLNQAVYNMVKYSQATIFEAVGMASYNPACYLELQNKLGHIAPGLLADLVIINDQFKVQQTIKEGKIIYSHQ